MFAEPLIASARAATFVLALALAVGSAVAQTPAPPDTVAPRAGVPSLTSRDYQDLDKVRAYLNGFKTLTADFTQLDPVGGESAGKLWVKRPGMLRFEYEPPVPILIVANGRWLVHYDRDMKTATYVTQSSTPAWFLVSSEIDLRGDVEVTKVERQPGRLLVTVVKTASPEDGAVTLVFTTDPMQLSQWIVVDPQGLTTQVMLRDLVLDRPLDDDRFVFNEPTVMDPRR